MCLVSVLSVLSKDQLECECWHAGLCSSIECGRGSSVCEECKVTMYFSHISADKGTHVEFGVALHLLQLLGFTVDCCFFSSVRHFNMENDDNDNRDI